jgi:hypothetical protein
MDPEKLQQAWQSQSCGTFGANPDLWLKVARLQRRAHFLADMIVVSFFSGLAVWMLLSAFRDIQRGWPWLIYCACLVWVVGYILFNRWRGRRNAAHYDESTLAHVEQSIDDIEHQMRLDRNAPWWYILPIALGCMIPPVLFFAMDYGKRPLLDSLIPFLRNEGYFAAIFIFVYLVMEFLRRMGLTRQLQELEALRALRESLLNTGE